MRNQYSLLTYLVLLILIGCASPARSWYVNLTPEGAKLLRGRTGINKQTFDAFISRQLEAFYVRWEVKFSPRQTDAQIDVWCGDNVRAGALGYAKYRSNRQVRENNNGVFIDAILTPDVSLLTDKEILQYIAYVIAHEVGHAYGLRHRLFSASNYVMSDGGAYPKLKYRWGKESVDKLDRLLR